MAFSPGENNGVFSPAAGRTEAGGPELSWGVRSPGDSAVGESRRPGSAGKPVTARILRQAGEEPTAAARGTEVMPIRPSSSEPAGHRRMNPSEGPEKPSPPSLARPPEAHQGN